MKFVIAAHLGDIFWALWLCEEGGLAGFTQGSPSSMVGAARHRIFGGCRPPNIGKATGTGYYSKFVDARVGPLFAREELATGESSGEAHDSMSSIVDAGLSTAKRNGWAVASSSQFVSRASRGNIRSSGARCAGDVHHGKRKSSIRDLIVPNKRR